MSLISETLILEQIKEMRAEQAQFRRDVLAELASVRALLVAQSPKAETAVPKPVSLPKFMTKPTMGDH